MVSLSDDTSVSGHNLSVGYEQNNELLVNMSFEFKPGEIIAINGASGIGKTTLLRTLAGLLNPLNGTVEIFGKSKRISR